MCIKAGAKVRKKILSTKYFPKNLMSEQGVCQCPSNYGPHPLISCSCLTCLSLVPRLLIARAPLAYRSCPACLSLVPRLLIARAPRAYRSCLARYAGVLSVTSPQRLFGSLHLLIQKGCKPCAGCSLFDMDVAV